jgi:hypothetical protein
LVHTRVAGLALQSSSEMHLVREGNWLDGLGGVAIQKIAYRRSHASVSRRKSALCLRFLGSVNASPRNPYG